MSYSVSGSTVKQDGKTLDTGSSHGDAVRAAQDRAKPGSAVGLRQTANVVVALDFEGAAPYHSTVDVEKASAADLATETDPAAVAELMKRKPADVQAAHQANVLVKFPDHDFEHEGIQYGPGDAVVLFENSSIKAFSKADFAKRFLPSKPAAGKTTDRKAAS